jgi:hypothetical protein
MKASKLYASRPPPGKKGPAAKQGPKLGNSLAEEKRTGEARPISSLLGREKESLKSGKQWEEFAAWCWSRGGEPRKKGFEKWKQTQANRHKGYVLDAKFVRSQMEVAK